MSDTTTGSSYWRDGFVTGVAIVDDVEAAAHRRRLEVAEDRHGPLHYIDKVHTALTSPFELATHSAALDVVEQLIGPNILLYNSTYIVKEAGSTAHVSWHQDLTYWGLADDDAQVSMWLALSPATELSGCMKMVVGSHRGGRLDHASDEDPDNVLLLSQAIADPDTATAITCHLQPGEASFHHGWTVHSSPPNRSADRRIGLNVQYLAPNNRYAADDHASAILVRGADEHGWFGLDTGATVDDDPVAIAAWRALDKRAKQGFRTTR